MGKRYSQIQHQKILGVYAADTEYNLKGGGLPKTNKRREHTIWQFVFLPPIINLC